MPDGWRDVVWAEGIRSVSLGGHHASQTAKSCQSKVVEWDLVYVDDDVELPSYSSRLGSTVTGLSSE